MCGIAGIAQSTSGISLNNLDAMIDSLEHRGPDGRGTWTSNTSSGGQIGLGHRRLAILDLSESGHQPMSRNNLHITFNGEIYNYRELRTELSRLGYQFRSESDTEVILACVSQWGIDEAIKKLNGMFAFAIFDSQSEHLHLVRDRAGVKPLYYYRKGEVLLFASELKALRQHPSFTCEINQAAVESYFQFGYVPGTTSIYQSVSKIRPGTIATFDIKSNNPPQIQQYWSIIDSYNQPKFEISFGQAVDQIDNLFQSAFSYRMISDVPVGVFLSGGYDSSLVTAVLQSKSNLPIKTFTIGFADNDFDESKAARKIAEHLGTDHHEQKCTEAEAQQIIPSLSNYYDEPFADASAIPTILVSQLARKSVTVALSADAGDELFGGYNKYQNSLAFFEKLDRVPIIFKNKTLLKILNQAFKGSNFGRRTLQQMRDICVHNATHCDLMKDSSQVFNAEDLKQLLNFERTNPRTLFDCEASLDKSVNTPLNKMLAIDYQTYLPDDILTKVDRASMSVSLEGREPLLDYRIAEFAAKLPSEYKIKGQSRKHILKAVSERYLPPEFLDRPKKGFSIPYYKWLRADLKYLIDENLSAERVNQAGILNYRFVRRYLDRFFHGDPRTNVGTWTLLMFQMWHRRWIENQPVAQ